ncbi:MAG TPA: hypothetical protein VKJ07_23305 [Mycobacteriales bacterium]|nr:hypothetical protein [Mycobacteriales bacterium]
MTLLRLSLLVALAICSGCDPGAPTRASDIQNLNGISDDISAVRMTDSHSRYTHDPNTLSTLPKSYEVNEGR